MSLELENCIIDPSLSDRQVFTAGNFVGQVIFQHVSERKQAFSNLRDSYFVLGGTLASLSNFVTDDNAHDTLATNNYFTQNVASALFSNATLKVNDTLVSSVVSWPVHSTHMKLMHESLQDQVHSGSPITPVTSSNMPFASGAADGAVSTHYNLRPKHYAGKINNAKLIRSVAGIRYNLNRKASGTPVEFAISFPFPFLEGHEDEETMDLYGNTKVEVTFQINPSLTTDLCNGHNFTAAELTVHTFQWCKQLYTMPSAPSNLKMERRFVDMITYRNSFVTNNFQWSIPSSTRRVLVSFMRKPSTNAASDAEIGMPTRVRVLAAGLAGNAAAEGAEVDPVETTALTAAPGALGHEPISRLYITFNGQTYPRKPYNLTVTAASGSDMRRAFDDYLRFSEAFPAGECNIISSFDQWMQTPVYAFLTTGNVGNSKDSMLTVYVETSSGLPVVGTAANTVATNQYDVCVSAEYIKTLSVHYDENGIPASTQVQIEA